MRARRTWLVGGALLAFALLLLVGVRLVTNGDLLDTDRLDGYPELTTSQVSTSAGTLFRLEDQALITDRQGEPVSIGGVAPALAIDTRAAADHLRSLLREGGIEYSAITSTVTVNDVQQHGATATASVDRVASRTVAGSDTEGLVDTYTLILTWSGSAWVVMSAVRTSPCC